MKKENDRPSKDNDFHLQDINIQACSTMDCTGLIPTPPKDDFEQESYEELYPYITKAIPTSPKSEG